MDLAIYRRRKLVNRIGLNQSMAAMALGLVVLLWILAVLFIITFVVLALAKILILRGEKAKGSKT